MLMQSSKNIFSAWTKDWIQREQIWENSFEDAVGIVIRE